MQSRSSSHSFYKGDPSNLCSPHVSYLPPSQVYHPSQVYNPSLNSQIISQGPQLVEYRLNSQQSSSEMFNPAPSKQRLHSRTLTYDNLHMKLPVAQAAQLRRKEKASHSQDYAYNLFAWLDEPLNRCDCEECPSLGCFAGDRAAQDWKF